MSPRHSRWLVALGAVVAAAAFGFGVTVTLQPAAPSPVMDQDGAVAACEYYVQDRYSQYIDSKLTLEIVQVLRASPVFTIKGKGLYASGIRHFAPHQFDWSCTVEADQGQWRQIAIEGPSGIG